MANITKSAKNVEKKVEKGIVEGIEKAKEVFANVARHIPLANIMHNRKKDTFTVEIDLPGVDKKDINVSIEGDYLIVTAERKMKNEVKADDYYLVESKFGKFYRTFYLSDDINRDSINAEYKDGRLVITFEKVENKKRRDISVK
jgi:HSP20 family protein